MGIAGRVCGAECVAEPNGVWLIMGLREPLVTGCLNMKGSCSRFGADREKEAVDGVTR